MNIGGFFSQSLSFVGAADPKIAVFLFLISLIGDAFVSVPYLLETVWLLAGYQFSKGILPLYFLVLMVAASQIGRLLGTIILSSFGRLG